MNKNKANPDLMECLRPRRQGVTGLRPFEPFPSETGIPAQRNINQLPLIPKPRKLLLKKGFLPLSQPLCLYMEQDATTRSGWQNRLESELACLRISLSFNVRQSSKHHIQPQNLHSEGYRMEVDSQGIMIAGKGTGIKHALQSLIQLIWWAWYHNEMQLPCLEIEDYPEYEWRGLHLDVSRHFFTAEEVCSYLDKMARVKLNRFHWHLTDDQGWRIESHKFPKLNTIAAWRKERDGSSYGGYYTREDIKQVVRYAAELGIEVIPEIDIPGHSQAILAAYNELACIPKAFETLNCWGISEDILCAGKDETLSFLKELFSEIAALFPGKYFHLGGDEAPKSNWKKCLNCQKRINDKGLADEEELQSWLLKELTKHLKNLGKTVIGWDEILDGKPGMEPIVMVWRGDGMDAAQKAESSGNRYILCPNQTCYFDWHQSANEGEPGAFGVTTLEQVYGFDPTRYGDVELKLLLGAQGNVWTEQMPSFERVIYMAFPRAFALAESLWSDPQAKDIEDFKARLQIMGAYL